MGVTGITGSMTWAIIDLKCDTYHLRSFGLNQRSPSFQSKIGFSVIKNLESRSWWQLMPESWTDDHGEGHKDKYKDKNKDKVKDKDKYKVTSAAGPVTSALPTPTLYKVIFCQWWQWSWWLALRWQWWHWSRWLALRCQWWQWSWWLASKWQWWWW